MDAPLASDALAAAIRDLRLGRVYRYWLSLKGDRSLPRRAELDPIDFAYALDNIMLIDVLRDPLRFRVRLHGRELIQRAGYDLTWKLLDDMPDDAFRLLMQARCETLVASAQPLVIHNDRLLNGHKSPHEALWLPLSDDGGRVSMLLCAMIYE